MTAPYTDRFKLRFKPHSDQQDDPEVVRRVTWNVLFDLLHRRLRRKASKNVLAYLGLEAYVGVEEDEWPVSAEELTFSFTDQQGNAEVSCRTGGHWMALAYAEEHAYLKGYFSRRGYELLTPPDDLREALTASRSAPLVEIGAELMMALPDPGREEGFKLWTDMDGPPWEKLPPRLRRKAASGFAAQRCGCEYCEKLRTRERIDPAGA